MSRLPIPGADDDVWGQILNEFLAVSHNPDGTVQASAVQRAGAITSLNGQTPVNGAVNLSAADVNAPTTLAGDGDVTIASPTNNQVLTYNSSSNRWVNQTPGSGIGLDGNATDIQPLGSRAAGSTGLAADAGHVHTMPRLDQINPPTASVPLNAQKLTGLANGTAATDAAAFGQIPASLPPNGSAGGDLGGTYPNPTVAKINGVSVSGTPSIGESLMAASNSSATWGNPLGVGALYVDAFGADPTGATDSTAAFVAAQAAGGSGYFVLILGVGTYLLGTAGDINVFGPNQGMIGQGSAYTKINYVGNSTCIQAYDSTFVNSHIGGGFRGFSVSGYTAGSSACGMSWGNLQGARSSDIVISGFEGASGIGLQFSNGASAWSEQAEWTSIRLVQNTVNVLFNNGSFDYSIYQFLIVADSGQDGVLLQNGAILAGCRLEIRGNFSAGAGNTAAIIALDRGNSSGTSQIAGAQMFINAECVGSSGTGHHTILLGGSNTSQFNGTGVLRFIPGSGGINFQGYSTVGGPQFGFSGIVYDPVLGKTIPSDALVVQGGSQWAIDGSLTVINGAQIFLEFGDVQALLLAGGNTNLAFFGVPTTRARRIELLIAQPASGASGTITWPGNVIFPGGVTPTLSTTHGAVDHVWMTYIPSSGNWYAQLAGTATNFVGTVSIAGGGTGQTTQQAAINALTGTQSGGTYLRSDGTNATLSAIAAADLPTATTLTQGAVTLDGTVTDIQSLGTVGAGSIGKAADAGHTHPAPSWVPADNSIKAAAGDPNGFANAGVAITAGKLYLVKVPIRSNMTISNIWFAVSVAGSGTGSNGSFVGLYNSSGTLLATSGDVAALFEATGPHSASISSQALTAGTFVWVALLSNITGGAGTQPAFREGCGGDGSIANLNLTAATFQAAANGTGLTSLSPSITPSSNTTGLPCWVGLS